MAVEGLERRSYSVAGIEIEIWSPPIVVLAPSAPVRQYSQRGSRLVAESVVIAVHVLGLMLATLQPQYRSSEDVSVVPSVLIGEFLRETKAENRISVFEITLVELPLKQLTSDVPPALPIHLNDADTATAIAPSIPFSAPRVEPGMVVESIPFVPNARWAAGRRVTVILAVDVSANGTVADVILERGTGDEAVDTTAIRHARKLRWIPGVLAGQPRQMRTRLVLTMRAAAGV